jgi:hypothetical protein
VSLASFLARHLGLTWSLGFGGMLLAALGQRRLAGLAWFALGAGSVGVAFDRACDKQGLMFADIGSEVSEEELDFLFGHLPFLAVGLLALLVDEGAE